MARFVDVAMSKSLTFFDAAGHPGLVRGRDGLDGALGVLGTSSALETQLRSLAVDGAGGAIT